jgi:hypothetical protein
MTVNISKTMLTTISIGMHTDNMSHLTESSS